MTKGRNPDFILLGHIKDGLTGLKCALPVVENDTRVHLGYLLPSLCLI